MRHDNALTRAATALLLVLVLPGCATLAQPGSADWRVRPDWVRSHESFLASDALQGRGSATRDEAIAAAYVAAQFEGYGLKPAPGMDGYLQTAQIVRPTLGGPPALEIGGKPAKGVTLLSASGESVKGKATIYRGSDLAGIPAADVVVLAAPDPSPRALFQAASSGRARLLIVKETEQTRELYGKIGGAPRMPAYLADAKPPKPAGTVATLPAKAFDALLAKPDAAVSLTLPGISMAPRATTNAIGYLPGSDPTAGVILLTAHLDHLGVRPDGTVMHGANDDASGTTAVLELARAMAAGRQPRRGILFVAYGSEEIGGFGSRYFAAHPPVPLADMVANIEFEMIGAQDPKLPKGTLMMTGFERSNLGPALKDHGALVTGDPYPDQHFFERSDNYQLALAGVVAHTVSGWAVTPTYHQPNDTLDSLDIPFMTRAIQSLIEPMRWLANSDFEPQWAEGGKPEK